MNKKYMADMIAGIMKNSVYVWCYNHNKVNADCALIQLDSSYSNLPVLNTICNTMLRNTNLFIAYTSYNKKKMEEIEDLLSVKPKWVKTSTLRYYNILSRASKLVNFERFETIWVKKKNQEYVKFIDDKVGFHLQEQSDLLQADIFLCDSDDTIRQLKQVYLLKEFSRAKIMKVSEADLEHKTAEDFNCNGKKNIVIYGAALEKNGLTSSLKNFLTYVGDAEINYLLCVKKTADRNKNDLPVRMIEFQVVDLNYTCCEALAELFYYKCNLQWKIWRGLLDRLYLREFDKNFANIRIHSMIQYTGYEADIIHLFSMGSGEHIIFVHNDMEREIKTRSAQHRETLAEMYKKYDVVALVNEELLESTKRIGGNEVNYQIAANFFDEKTIREKAKADIAFQDHTESNFSLEDIEQILRADTKKFITIGRFSPEKGHLMLLDAFSQYLSEGHKAHLFIIGGRGPLYEQTLKYSLQLGIGNQVIVIKNIDNPISILKRCDLFLLSSLYEGFGLVVLEAAAVGIPVISTDIVGPANFVKRHGGLIVECSSKGLYQGMIAFEEGKVKIMEINFDQYNENCKCQIGDVLKQDII